MSNTQEEVSTFSRIDGPIKHWNELQQSLLFAELAKISYFDPDKASEKSKEIGFTKVDFIENNGAQVYLFSTNDELVIAFRGTEVSQWNDVKADLRVWPVISETIGRVHRGFKQEVDDLWPLIENRLLNNTKQLWICGHSLGAAMATICASRCLFSNVQSDNLTLFTYGSPRVGSKKYITHSNVIDKRWVNNNDIVTRVPPVWLGYRHIGDEIYLNAYGKVRKMSGYQRIKDRMRGFIGGLKQGRVDHFSDHSINGYIKHIHQAHLESIA